MPTINEWRGDAPEQEARFSITILQAVPFAVYALDLTGTAGIRYRATQEDTVGTIADAIAAAIATFRLRIEHEPDSPTVIVVGETGEGLDIAAPKVPSSFVRIVREGREPIAQEIEITLPDTTSGGTWGATFNWGGADETLSSLSATITPAALKAAIEGLSTPGADSATVWLVHPGGSGESRIYRIRLEGNLIGTNATVTVTGAALLGNATTSVITIQDPRERVHEIQAIWVREKIKSSGQPAWKGVIGVSIDGKTLTLKPNAGTAAWTAAGEAQFGAGNIRIINYTLDGFPVNVMERLALIFVVFMEEQAGIAHSLATVALESGGADYLTSVQRKQAGNGSVSSEWSILVGDRGGLTAVYDQYLLDFDGQVTDPIDLDTPSQVVTELEALSNVATDEPFIHESPLATNDFLGKMALLEWKNAKANTNTVDIQPSSELVDETGFDAWVKRVRTITTAASANDIQVVWSRYNAVSLAKSDGSMISIFDASTNDETDLQGDFDAAFGSGNTLVKVVVNRAVFPQCHLAITVEFKGALAGDNQPILRSTVWTSGGTSDPTGTTVVRLNNADDPARQWQALNLGQLELHYSWARRPNTGYKLTLDSVETGLIEPNVYTGLELALEALTGQDVKVTTSTINSTKDTNSVPAHADEQNGIPMPIVFIGFPTAQTALDVTFLNRISTAIVDGSPLLNEIQRIVVLADGGSLKIRHNGGSWSSGLTFPATTSQWDTEIESAITGDVTTTGLGTPASPLDAEFTGSQAKTNVPLLEIDGALLVGGKAVVAATVIQGVPGVDELQEINVDRNAVGGTLRGNFDGAYTADVDFDGDGADWKTALEGTLGIGSGNVDAEGPAGGPILVRFKNSLGLRNVPQIQLDQDNLDVAEGGAMRTDELQKGTGPGHWNEPTNWVLGHVPETGEVAALTSGKPEITGGLAQRTTFIVSGSLPSLTLKVGLPCDLVENQKVRIRNVGGALPAAEEFVEGDWETLVLTSNLDLFIIAIDRLKGTMQLATALDEPAIRFTSAGTGTHIVEVKLQAIVHYSRCALKLGRQQRLKSGVWETRPLDLRVGFLTPAADAESFTIGLGDGSGAGRFNLDFDGSPAKGTIIKTGSSNEAGLMAVALRGTHADADIEQLGGDVAYCARSGDTGTIKRFTKRAGNAIVGNVEAEAVQIDVLDCTSSAPRGHYDTRVNMRQ